jgi:hypothetical protein
MIWFFMRRKEIIGIIVLVVCVAFIALMSIKFPDVYRRVNSGSGPDWECSPAPGRGSACVKKPNSN